MQDGEVRNHDAIIAPGTPSQEAAIRSLGPEIRTAGRGPPYLWNARVMEDGSDETFSAKVRSEARTDLSWTRAWVAETAIRFRLSCNSL